MHTPLWTDYQSWKTARWKTAIARQALSRPCRTAIANRIFQENYSLLDYGCGRGDDVRNLTKLGFTITGYDPYWQPNLSASSADAVLLNFVLNTIEDAEERPEVLKFTFALANQALIVAVRTDGSGEVNTKMGTFQKYFTQQEAQDFLVHVLGKPATVTALIDPKSNRSDGIFLVRKSSRLTILPPQNSTSFTPITSPYQLSLLPQTLPSLAA